ncbi:MAG: helix-turn-helix domain-containing protein, partial [bacterium]
MESITLADLLAKFRDNRGESQKEVAAELDMPPPSLSFYENGERTPPFHVLLELLDYYDARLTVETDLGEWIFKKDKGTIELEPEEKIEQMGLLSGLDEKEKEDL